MSTSTLIKKCHTPEEILSFVEDSKHLTKRQILNLALAAIELKIENI